MAEQNKNYSSIMSERFFRNVFGIRVGYLQNKEDMVARDGMMLLRYVGALVSCVNLFWLGYYYFGNASPKPVTWYFYTLQGMTVLSVIAVMLSMTVKGRWGNNLGYRLVFHLYYISLVFYVTVVSVSKNMELVAYVDSGDFGSIGVPLVAYLLMAMAFLPMPSMTDSLALCAYLLIGTIAPLYLPGKEAYNILQQAMLRICILFAYFAYRKHSLNSARFIISESDLRDDIERRACTDELTSALNLRAFQSYCSKISKEKTVRNVGVFSYDIDDFKRFNDFYSHSRGDKILQRIITSTIALLEMKDGYLFRYGGDEVVIIRENVSESEMIQFGELLRNRVWESNISRHDGHGETRMTITVGCALIDGNDLETADIISIAEQQLAIGKSSGKNCTVFRDRTYGKELHQQFRAGDSPVISEETQMQDVQKRTIVLIAGASYEKRGIISSSISGQFTVLEADSGASAVQIIWNHLDEIAAFLLAEDLPDTSCKRMMETVREKKWNKVFPIILLVGQDYKEEEWKDGFLGAADVLRAPYSSTLVSACINNNIERFQLRMELEQLEQTRLETLRTKNSQLQLLNDRLIEVTCEMVEARSLESGSHVRRVKSFVRALAEQLMQNFPECGLTPERINCITYMSAMHDVGKIKIRDSVLLKPGRLTEEEFEHMKTHTLIGCDFLQMGKDLWNDEYYRVGYEIIRHHHEKYDGKGYPDGISGEDIPIEAQIVSICDCFDALTTDRVYKKAYSVDSAYDMIIGGRCGEFSPRMISTFLRARPKFEQIIEEYKEQAAD